MENAEPERETAFDELISRLGLAKKRISDIKDRPITISQARS